MSKRKTHKGIAKRFKKTKSKRGGTKFMRQSKGRGSRHLKTKQTNKRKRRIRRKKIITNPKLTKRLLQAVNT